MSSCDWSTVNIGSICDGIFDGPHATPTKTDSGPIFLGISNLNNGRIDLTGAEHLSEEDFVRWTRRVVPQESDIVFSYETRLGETAMIPRGLRCCLGRRMALMRPNRKKVEPRFLLYAYMGPEFQNILRKHTIPGSTVDRIPLTEFPRFPIRIPPLPQQRAIATILGALDDKIELNRRMNETLEAMARAIFTSWFVDFDPVRAKMEGRQPFGMDADTAALFPESLAPSSIGEIPGDWKVSPIGKIVEFAYGKALKADVRRHGTIPVYGSNGQVGWHDEALAKGSGIVIGRKGNAGTVTWVPSDFFPIDTTFYIVPTATIQSMYYLFYALSILELASLGADSAVPGLNRNIAYMTEMLAPPMTIIGAFEEIVAPLLAHVRVNVEEIRTLSALRDVLLPKLLSGEIRAA